MNRWTMLFATVIISVLIVTGCSGGDGNPASPAATDPVMSGSTNNAGQTQTHLWGYYDVFINIENQTAEAVVNRDGQFHANVVTFVNQYATLAFDIIDTSIDPGGTYVDVDIDVLITHPLPYTQYNGYDVRGIFIADGSSSAMGYNGDLHYAVEGTDQFMKDYNETGDTELCGNADGYTRWWNPDEFTTGMNVLGYTAGDFASNNYEGSAELNPYKYFADGLDADDDLWEFLTTTTDEGVFTANTTNTRNYYLRFPTPAPSVTYGYAIVANWEEPVAFPPPNNAPEALAVSVNVDPELWYTDATTYGGNLVLDIEVFDWEAVVTPAGVMEDYIIHIDSEDVLAAVYEADTLDMTPTGGIGYVSTYHLDIPAVPSFNSNTAGHDAEYWVIIEEADEDYTNTFGVNNDADTDKLAVFFRFDNLYIHNESTNTAPICDVVLDASTPSPAEGLSPVPMSFDASGSSDPDGDTLTYSWDFDGDGIYDEDPDDSYTGDPSNPMHGYVSDYTGQVCVKVSDSKEEVECCVTEIQVTTHSSKNLDLRAGIAVDDIAISHSTGDLYVFYCDSTIWKYTASSYYTSGSELSNASQAVGGMTVTKRRIDVAPNDYIMSCFVRTSDNRYYNTVLLPWGSQWSIVGVTGLTGPDRVHDTQAFCGEGTNTVNCNDGAGSYYNPGTSANFSVICWDYDTPVNAYNAYYRNRTYNITDPQNIVATESSRLNESLWVLMSGTSGYKAERYILTLFVGWSTSGLNFDDSTIGTGSQTYDDDGFYDPLDITRNNGDRLFVLDYQSAGVPVIKVWDDANTETPTSEGSFGDATTIDSVPYRIEGSDYDGNVIVLHEGASSTYRISIFTPAEMP